LTDPSKNTTWVPDKGFVDITTTPAKQKAISDFNSWMSKLKAPPLPTKTKTSTGAQEPDPYEEQRKYYEALMAQWNDQEALKEFAATEDKAAEIMDKLKSSVRSLTDEIKAQASTFTNFAGIFEKLDNKAAISGESWIKRLTNQVKAMTKWRDGLSKLEAGGVLDPSIIAQLRSMGPSSANQIAKVANMSVAQLQKVNDLYGQKSSIGYDQAIAATNSANAQSSYIDKQINLKVDVNNADAQTIANEIISILKLNGVNV
jgi:hypothetical protein